MSSGENRRIVLVLSGGMESSVIAAIAGAFSPRAVLHALFVDYGQRAVDKERVAVRHLARKYGIQMEEAQVVLPFLENHLLIDPSTMIYTLEAAAKLDLPWKEGVSTRTGHIVPLRNLFLVAMAASYAETVQATEVWTGFDYRPDTRANPEEVATDKSPAFSHLLSEVIREGGSKERPLHVLSPLQNMTKPEIQVYGTKLGVDWHHSWSCYNSYGLHCGVCGPCEARKDSEVPTIFMDESSIRSLVM